MCWSVTNSNAVLLLSRSIVQTKASNVLLRCQVTPDFALYSPNQVCLLLTTPASAGRAPSNYDTVTALLCSEVEGFVSPKIATPKHERGEQN